MKILGVLSKVSEAKLKQACWYCVTICKVRGFLIAMKTAAVKLLWRATVRSETEIESRVFRVFIVSMTFSAQNWLCMQLSWAQGLVFSLKWSCTQIVETPSSFSGCFLLWYTRLLWEWFYWIPSTELKIVATKIGSILV